MKNEKTPYEKFHDQFNDHDYHNFSHRGSTKEFRTKMNIGNLYLNAAVCNECGYFIRSRNRHDMVHCLCGKTYIDGGSNYQRISGPATSIIELYDDVKKEETTPEKKPNRYELARRFLPSKKSKK